MAETIVFQGVDPQTLFNFAKTVHEKENLQVSMIIEDVDKMFIPYDNPKQQKNIREFIRLMAEFNSIPGSILILGTKNNADFFFLLSTDVCSFIF